MSMLHSTCLPFTAEQLRTHFAPVRSSKDADPGRHLAHYVDSIRRSEGGEGTKKAQQIEKDERFWIAASLMALFHSESPAAAFSSLLAGSGAAHPSEFSSWGEALSGDLELYFDVGLTSPESYRADLQKHLDERAPIPYVRQAAERAGLRLEGATQVDALLIAAETGAGVLFEAKVLSDCSSAVTYDILRNQLARNIDVMLETQPALCEPLSSRIPKRSAFVLLTPELFRAPPQSRLYGWLMKEYRSDPDALARDLPHRGRELDGVSDRIGWVTFEDGKRIVPEACPWLPGHPATLWAGPTEASPDAEPPRNRGVDGSTRRDPRGPPAPRTPCRLHRHQPVDRER